MPTRTARVTTTVNLAAGIALALLLQLLSVRGLGAERLPAGCGKYSYYECATEGKVTVGAFPEKTIHRWHRPN